MIKQIKTHVIKLITGGYSICKCHNQPPFALISDNEDACKAICCEIMSSKHYKFNNSEKKLCHELDIKIKFKNDIKRPHSASSAQINNDLSWF